MLTLIKIGCDEAFCVYENGCVSMRKNQRKHSEIYKRRGMATHAQKIKLHWSTKNNQQTLYGLSGLYIQLNVASGV